MAFSPQRILKSKYLVYRYFEAMRKNNSVHSNAIPILAYDDIVKDAIEKVNSLTGKSYLNPPAFPEHKEMYVGNVNMAINSLVEMAKPECTCPLPNFHMFSIKNNDDFPHAFVLNKAEMCMYTIGYINRMIKKRKLSAVSRIIDILSKNKLLSIVGITSKDLDDECTYAESQLAYVGRNTNVVIFQALCNCNKIDILIEYLVTHKRSELFNYFPVIYNRKNDVFKPIVCTNEGKYYYIVPFTHENEKFDISYY
jgi:hypothetical protein